MNSDRAARIGLVVLSVLAGVTVFLIVHEVFPYLSSNHDEGVYLQQAAMLLEGNLWLTSGVAAAVRPWFFIEEVPRLYPKYTPVAALMYAPGVAVGAPRVILAVIAAGNVALVGTLATEAFDRPTGVVAAGFALATPFFLFISATFMSYAPTTLLNLLFALGYVRMFRREHDRRYAVLAGAAIGLAFFSRPYTAVLFAVPFVVHAAFVVGQELRDGSFRTPTVEREAIVGVFGIAGVGVALAYNHVVTGDASLFPYEAFAPLDGLGFGRRKLLGREIEYTIELAWRANKHLVAELFTRWTVAAPIGSLLAGIGLVPLVLGHREQRTDPISDRTLRLLLLGVGLSVLVGNIYFWGTLNVLGNVSDPTDGFIGGYGPFYHFDLVLPLSVFGSAGVFWLGRTLRSTFSQRFSPRQVRALFVVLVVVSVPVCVSAEYEQLHTTTEQHTTRIEQQESVYAPFENRTFENALVFMPLPQGPWLSHPFQALRNGGSLEDGSVLYAQHQGPALNFDTLDVYSNRTPYRFTYRGRWPGVVTPKIQPLTVHNGTAHQLTTTVESVGRPSSVRLSTFDDRIVQYPSTNRTDGSFDVTWTVTGTEVRLDAINGRAVNETSSERTQPQPLSGPPVAPVQNSSPTSIETNGSTRATLAITFVRPDNDTVTYRYQLDIDPNADSVRVLWPGRQKVCNDSRYCGNEGTYISGEEYPGGATMNTTHDTTASNA